MKSKSSKKAAAAEDEAKSKKLRSSRGKRRRGRHSRSSSSRSESPPRKRSKKLKISDKKSTKNKGSSRRRHHSLSPSPSLSSSPSSSSSMSYSTRSSDASERSVSPPRRSRSRDARKKKKVRGRDSKRGRRSRRSRSYSTSGESSDSRRSRSRSKNSKSRKRRSGRNKDHASRDKIVQDYDNGHACRAESVKSVEDVGRDEEAVAVIDKRNSIDHEKNVSVKKMESPPTKNADDTEDILPAGSGSPDAVELEMILRQKALENFRKFRGAAVMAGKTHTNGTGKEAVPDSPKSNDTKIAEASSVDKSFQRQRSGLSLNCTVGSPRLEDFGNHTTPRKQESSAGKSPGVESPGTFEAGSTSGRTEQKGSSLEAARSNSQIRLQDGRSSSCIIHRLGSPPGSSVSIKQRLGSSVGVSYVNGNPRVRSVVSIPTKEGLDGGTSIATPNSCDNSPPAGSISEVRDPPIETNKVERTGSISEVMDPPIETNKVERTGSISEVRDLPIEMNKVERTNGDENKSGEASAPNVSTMSTSEVKDQPVNEGKDGSQFEKKTFSRMHEGETVQVSYKVYIPKKSPALARRKLQR